MRCLGCWSEIEGEVAVFTKSCHHVFCEPCSEKSFEKELSCPFCDTVLAKDGIGELVLKPDDLHLKKTSAKLFGFEPEKLCETLQMGLEFWAKQQKNESIQHIQELRRMKKRAEEAELCAQKLSKALEDERLKKKSLQNEREDLKRHISELETRYAEKSRSMRKLNDLYSELRQVHRRLEIDLRGVRDTHELHVDRSERRTLEINTRRRKDPRTSLPIQEHHLSEKVGARVNERARDKSERISMNPAGDIEKQYSEPQRESLRSSRTPRSYNSADSKSYEPLFALAPNHAFSLNRNISREPRKEATHRSRGSSIGHDKNENEGPRPRHI